MTIAFELAGQEFVALNGGPQFKFTEAIFLVVNCETQEEVDELWEKLSEDGTDVQCGWLKDKYGLSWQIVPTILFEMLQDKDPQASQRVMKALFQMKAPVFVHCDGVCHLVRRIAVSRLCPCLLSLQRSHSVGRAWGSQVLGRRCRAA
jgi:hypothetical protein